MILTDDVIGRKFKGYYVGGAIPHQEVSGVIIRNNIGYFLCNDLLNGESIPKEFRCGYKYSYRLTDYCAFFINIQIGRDMEPGNWKVGDMLENKNTDCSNLKVIFESGELVILKKRGGNASENYTKEEMYNRGWRLKKESPTIEVTLEEVAKKMGIPVDKLRIKD